MKIVCICVSVYFMLVTVWDLWDLSSVQTWDFARLTAYSLLMGVKIAIAFYFLQLAKMC
jgi:hypothetical protein